MIAYNKEWLDNLLIQQQLDAAYHKNFINKEEFLSVNNEYAAGFYTPNIFIRIGLFILTLVIVSFSMGLVALIMVSGVNEKTVGALLLFFGVLVLGVLQFIIQKKHHYKSGVDDALLWVFGGCIIGGINLMMDISTTGNALLIVIFSVILFLRFTNALMGGVAALAFLTVVFLSYSKFGNFAKATTSFLIMLLAAIIYVAANNLFNQSKFRHYKSGITVIKIVTLFCTYAAVNYFIVREGSIALFNLTLKEGESIPFGWLFWSVTFVIPIVYIYMGIKKKLVLFLRVGLLLTATIVFTVRYYHPVLPLEMAMTFGGLLLIGIAYALIQYLQQPKYGFTYQKIIDSDALDKLNIEGIVIAETFGGVKSADANNFFGGGSFGGGGATDKF